MFVLKEREAILEHMCIEILSLIERNYKHNSLINHSNAYHLCKKYRQDVKILSYTKKIKSKYLDSPIQVNQIFYDGVAQKFISALQKIQGTYLILKLPLNKERKLTASFVYVLNNNSIQVNVLWDYYKKEYTLIFNMALIEKGQ